MMKQADHFLALDGARGIAAICVVCLHASGNLPGLPAFAHASFAVDLFFILSGFVLEHAYGRRLAGGWTVRDFFLVRVIRLYPLYALATAIGALLVVAAFVFGRHPPSMGVLAVDLAFGLLMLPSPARIEGGGQDVTFGIVPPAWSLFFELFINVVYAFVHPRLNRLAVVIVMLVSAACLVAWNVAAGGLEAGNLWSNFLGGFPRVTFGFFTGVALYRSSSDVRWPVLPPVTGLPLAAAIVALCVWHPGWLLWDSLVVLLLLPTLVAAGSRIRVTGKLSVACALLGSSSYAIYVLHMPILGWVQQAARRYLDYSTDLWAGPAFLGLALGAALAAHRWFDKPARRWLAHVLSRGTAPQALTRVESRGL